MIEALTGFYYLEIKTAEFCWKENISKELSRENNQADARTRKHIKPEIRSFDIDFSHSLWVREEAAGFVIDWYQTWTLGKISRQECPETSFILTSIKRSIKFNFSSLEGTFFEGNRVLRGAREISKDFPRVRNVFFNQRLIFSSLRNHFIELKKIQKRKIHEIKISFPLVQEVGKTKFSFSRLSLSVSIN